MSEGTANVSTDRAATTFVLVPGAGTDPRVYGATIAALRELGQEGIAPPLPLDDAAATPSDHADAILAAATLAASAAYEGVPSDGLFEEPLPLEAWPDVPTTVLIPRADRLFPLEFQRRVARERLGLEIEEMEGGHLPFLSRPRELAERLVALA